jgi:hypothetical protein
LRSILPAQLRNRASPARSGKRATAFEIALSKAKSKFREEEDGSPEMMNYIVNEIATFELDYGPQLDIAGLMLGSEAGRAP